MKKIFILSGFSLLITSCMQGAGINVEALERGLHDKYDAGLPYSYLITTNLEIKKNGYIPYEFKKAVDLKDFLLSGEAYRPIAISIPYDKDAIKVSCKDVGLAIAAQLGVSLEQVLIVSKDFTLNSAMGVKTKGAVADIYSDESYSFKKYLSQGLLRRKEPTPVGVSSSLIIRSYPRILVLDTPELKTFADAEAKLLSFSQGDATDLFDVERDTQELSDRFRQVLNQKLSSSLSKAKSYQAYVNKANILIEELGIYNVRSGGSFW